MLFFFYVILTGREKINMTPLKLLRRDKTCEPIKISMSRMRVAIMMFYRMNITHNLLI